MKPLKKVSIALAIGLLVTLSPAEAAIPVIDFGAIAQLISQMQTLQQQLNSPSIDPDKKEPLAKKYRDVEFEAKKMQEDSQQEYQRVERKVGEAITKIAAPIVEQLAKEQKLQLVLSDQAVGILSWGDADWMKAFTAEVSKRLDATEGAPAASAAASKPAAAAPKPAAPKAAAPKK